MDGRDIAGVRGEGRGHALEIVSVVVCLALVFRETSLPLQGLLPAWALMDKGKFLNAGKS